MCRFSGGTIRARPELAQLPARTRRRRRQRAARARRRGGGDSLPSTLAPKAVTCLSRLCDKCVRSEVQRADGGPQRGSSRGRRAATKSRPALAAGPRRAEVHEPDRLLLRPAAGPGDPGHRHRDVRPEPRPRARAPSPRPSRARPRRAPRAPRSGTPSSASLTPFGVRDDRRRGRRRSSPGTDVSRAATSPPVHDSAVASVRPRSRQQRRAPAPRSAPRCARRGTARAARRSAASSASARASAPGATKRSTWISMSRAQIVTSTPSPSPPAASSACATADSRDAVEAQHAPLGRPRAREQPPQRLGLERLRPERLQLARRPRQRHRDARRRASSDERRRGAGEPGDDRALRARSPACGRRARSRRTAASAARRPRATAPRSAPRAPRRRRAAARPRARAARPCGRRASARARPR